ncbi:MAG TPA: type II toxin-antitoxin system VapC family toxin [Terriglobales bacterium]|nr:type II toxin-antitoxin system VapC family toxin [Terriglobales bacterium]
MTAVLSRRSARRYVLDANALSGFFEDREGTAGKIEKLLGEALSQDLAILMSAVNWGEVFYVAWRRHGETYAWQAEARLGELPIAVIAADRERASRAGALKQRHGLGYADAFAAELAIERGAWLVTADPEFQKVGKALSIYSLPRHEK